MERPQSDFLYKRMGPWPQPNPVLPFTEFPAVVNIPRKELMRYELNIGVRYYTQIFYYLPVALWYGINHAGLAKVSDEEFVDMLCVRSFSKFLTKLHRDQIEKYLPGIDMSRLPEDREYYVNDLWLMSKLKPQEGCYTAATVCLFARSDSHKYGFEFLANFCLPYGEPIEKGTVLYPEDNDAWDLAKYHSLLGCANRLVLSTHSFLHFPMDTVNAITKTALPKDNLLQRLLLPHFEFSLELDLGVLTSWESPIKNHWELPYTGLTGDEAGIAQLFVDAYMGMKDRHLTYPPYHFWLEPQVPDTEYGRFQIEYYNCIERFAKKVLSKLTDDDKWYIRKWADYICGWLNTNPHMTDEDKQDIKKRFPNGDEIFEEYSDGFTILEKVTAKIIWDVTVGHASDHYDYGKMDVHKVPFRLRVPAPQGREVHHYTQKSLRTWVDAYKQRMCWKMFFIPTNVTLLQDMAYDFGGDPELEQYTREFKKELHETEKGLAEKGIRDFIPLKEIARSIQY